MQALFTDLLPLAVGLGSSSGRPGPTSWQSSSLAWLQVFDVLSGPGLLPHRHRLLHLLPIGMLCDEQREFMQDGRSTGVAPHPHPDPTLLPRRSLSSRGLCWSPGGLPPWSAEQEPVSFNSLWANKAPASRSPYLTSFYSRSLHLFCRAMDVEKLMEFALVSLCVSVGSLGEAHHLVPRFPFYFDPRAGSNGDTLPLNAARFPQER